MSVDLHRLRTDILAEWQEQTIALTLEQVTDEVLNTLRDVAPVGPETDDDTERTKLRDSHSIDKRGDFDYIIVSSVEHAEYVITGTPPHTIRARPGNVLHWEHGGQDRFAKSVRHPGTEPNNYVQTALDREQPRIDGYFSESSDLVQRRLKT